MEQKPLISVIIPTYNREKLIERAVRSVLNQSYSNLEVIVVDDGSTDQTEAIVKGILDERVHFYKMLENEGAGHARNEGVKLSNGEIIAFHDSDDEWRPEKLQRQMDYWLEHPEFSMVYCAYLCHLADGRMKRIPAEQREELEGDLFAPLLKRNIIGAPTILVMKKKFLECGGFDISYRSLEDWEFLLRFTRENKIGYVNEILIDVHMGNDGVSSNVGEYFNSRCRMIAMYKDNLTERNCYTQVIEDVLQQAEGCGILEQVGKMLMLLLR